MSKGDLYHSLHDFLDFASKKLFYLIPIPFDEGSRRDILLSIGEISEGSQELIRRIRDGGVLSGYVTQEIDQREFFVT